MAKKTRIGPTGEVWYLRGYTQRIVRGVRRRKPIWRLK